MVPLFELFYIFFNIGAFTLGGGYAMLSMVEMSIVTKKQYVDKEEFWDLISLVQTLPGVFAVNTALYVGYKLRGIKGAICAALGAVLPSFIIILLIALFFTEFKDNEVIENIFKGIRPCVVALILVPSCKIIINQKMSWKILWIPIAIALGIWLLKISPVIIIVTVIVGTLVCEWYSFRKIKKQ